MGRMEQNPYATPPITPIPLSTPRKLSLGAKVFRVGVLLLTLAFVGFACFFGTAIFLLENDMEVPDWVDFSASASMMMLPIGFLLTVTGGVIWCATRLVRRRSA